MTKEGINKYREDCVSDVRNIHKDLDDRVAFIIIAAIGFFVAKSESFYQRNPIMIVLYCSTLFCLFISFVFFLLNKHIAIKEINDHLEFIDTQLKPECPELDKKLITDWEQARKRSGRYQKRVYALLVIGFITGIAFFMINTLSKHESEKIPQPFKVEVH